MFISMFLIESRSWLIHSPLLSSVDSSRPFFFNIGSFDVRNRTPCPFLNKRMMIYCVVYQ